MNPIAIAFAFFTSPLGKWAGIGLVGVLLFFAGDIRGRRIEHAKCEAAAKAAIIAANQQDSKARKEVADQSESTIADLKTQKDKSNARVVELENQLRTMPMDAPCLYGAGGQPASGRVRNDGGNASPRTGNARTPRPAAVSPAGRSTAR